MKIMAPIIEVSDETLKTLNPKVYTMRKDLETKTKQIAGLDRSNWIVIPYEFTNGKYALEVDPARLFYNPVIEKVAKDLDLNLKNTLKDSLGREFIGDINWNEALRINQALGNKTLNPKEGLDFLKLLYLGSERKIKVYNVSGKQIDSKLCEKYFSDIVKIKSPQRAEWLDADFKTNGKDLEIHSNHIFDSNGKIINYDSELLDKDTLMKDKTPGISLEDWINNPTRQGLPTKKTKSGDFNYWYPRSDDNSVARFYDSGDWVVLNCFGDPSFGDSNLGVRGAVRKA